MIIHNCIECDFCELIPIAPQCPAWEKYICPECKTIQWIRHSRIDPMTYSEDMIEADETNHTIKIK